MRKTFEVQVRVSRQKLSSSTSRTLSHIEKYDWILFTSKHAVQFFAQVLREKQITLPRRPRIAAVGPTTAKALRGIKLPADIIPERFTVRELSRKIGAVRGRRILLPRSAIAPFDIVRSLRARGARVTVVPLYTTKAAFLPTTAKRALLAGAYTQLTFKSPSGVKGLMRQLSKSEQKVVRKISAQCIGETTAQAARSAGFEKVSIKSVL